ncbi:DNA polymerase epsilon subunit C-like isoform X2 [Cucurbita maxima]|nr:DNA polymerase epsilon subunit C-like isoform X2 [Cucurbita maxima]
MASSKKSSSEAKSKEAGTSKPAPKNKTHNNNNNNNNNARKVDKVYSKKKKVSSNNNKHTSNGSVKENEVLPISAPGDAEEDRVETTSKSPNTSKSKKVKRNHGKKEENGYAEEEEEEEEEAEEEAEEKIYKFPMNRIKKIMRDENSDLRINQEALFLVNKATEMFLVQFCKDAYACCAQDRKKSLAYKHL